jgi:hypothetical protein
MNLRSDAGQGWLPNYFVETKYFIDWSSTAVSSMHQEPHSDMANIEFRFHKGITYSRTGEYAPTFRLSAGGILESKSCGIFPENFALQTLLAILCSQVARYLLKVFIMHSVETSVGTIGDLPIKRPKDNITHQLNKLVAKIIEQQKINSKYPYHLHEQKEIDDIIYQLYELDYEDIREIELWYCRRYPKLAEAQGILDAVKEKYERHIEHCRRVLAKPPTYWKSHPIRTLIAQGEGSKLEFKETLRVDIKTNTTNKDVLFASLKTIAAYLNTEGGTLLIGVSDNLEIKGLERDYSAKLKNRDSFENNLQQFLEQKIKPFPLPSNQIYVEFITVPEGEICKIDVKPLDISEIAELEGKVFIRDGNRSKELKAETLENWKQKREPL